MAFYSAGLAIVTTAYRRGLSNLQRRCVNGHVVAYDDRFCATCGVSLEAAPAAAGHTVNADERRWTRNWGRRAD